MSPGLLGQPVVFFIRVGFPLDFDRTSPLQSHLDNHASAKLYPQNIQAYLQEEIGYKVILGPFKDPPITGLHIGLGKAWVTIADLLSRWFITSHLNQLLPNHVWIPVPQDYPIIDWSI